MIAVVDYRAGNVASVCKALQAVGAEARLTGEPADAAAASGIVVPGVGHFEATTTLGDDWRSLLRRHAAQGRPLLGICLGMQWLFEASDEAPGQAGLALLPGRCRRLPGKAADGERVKVPHVGWNSLRALRPSGVLAHVPDEAFVYFTHSYAVEVSEACVATTCHGNTFAAVVERQAVWGTQFHPEKSGEVGLRILRNFVERAAAR